VNIDFLCQLPCLFVKKMVEADVLFEKLIKRNERKKVFYTLFRNSLTTWQKNEYGLLKPLPLKKMITRIN